MKHIKRHHMKCQRVSGNETDNLNQRHSKDAAMSIAERQLHYNIKLSFLQKLTLRLCESFCVVTSLEIVSNSSFCATSLTSFHVILIVTWTSKLT